MPHYAVIAIGADRPGIVAALTGRLFEMGGNLEDVASSILRGNFASMLVVDAPDQLDAGTLQSSLAEAVAPLGVAVTVRDVEDGTPRRAQATHGLTVYAADRPGIVAKVTGLLAERGANITDLSCRVTGQDEPVYVMVADVALPSAMEAAAIEADLQRVAGELGVDVSFRPLDVDTL